MRLFNVIGPGETNPHILPAILAQVLKGRRTLRLGNCHPGGTTSTSPMPPAGSPPLPSTAGTGPGWASTS